MRTITSLVVVASLLCLFTTLAGPAELPANLRAILEKNASFHLDRFPIGFWNYTDLTRHGSHMTEAEVQGWADAGFTLPMSPDFDPAKPEQMQHMRNLLAWAVERHMKVILCDRRANAPVPDEPGAKVPVLQDQEKKIASVVADFYGNPAVFGVEIGDEPSPANLDAFLTSARLTKAAAPEWHPFINHLPYYSPGLEKATKHPMWSDIMDLFAKAAKEGNLDLLCYDCYAQMLEDPLGVEIYYGNLRLFREGSRRTGLPFWNTVLSVPHFVYRAPSYDDLRWQFNTSLASGAQGILWFFYYMREPHGNYRLAPIDENWDRTPAWYDLRRLHLDFHRRYGDLFLRLVSTRVAFYPKAFAGGTVFAPDVLVSDLTIDNKEYVDDAGVHHNAMDPKHPLLLGEFADLQGRRYVMLVNNSQTRNVRVAMTFPGKDVKVYSCDWSGAEVEGPAYCADSPRRTDSGLQIWHWLAPGQEAVYRVDSEQIRAAKIVAE